MSCLKDNTRLITLLGGYITTVLIDKSKSDKPFSVDEVVKQVYDNFKKINASEELSMDAARMAPFLMLKVVVNAPDITANLEKVNPDILIDISVLRKKLLNDDSNFTALKGILGIGVVDTSESDALEDAIQKAKTPSVVKTVAGKISNIFSGFKTFAQELINFENANAPDYLIPKREYVRSSEVKKNIDRLLNNQIAYNDISNSSQLVLPGLSKPGVYLRSMPVKKALELYPMAFKDYRSNFYPDFVNILVDSDGNAIRFDNSGNVNQREGDPVFYAIESKPLRLSNGALVIDNQDYAEYEKEFKQSKEYANLSDNAKKTRSYVDSQIFKQVKQRINEIEKSKYPEDSKLLTNELMDQIYDEAVQDVVVFYNNLDAFLNHLKNNPDDVIDNVFVKSGKGFITSNIYKPSKLSSISLPKGQEINIDVVTAEQALGSSLVPGNAYIKVPGIDEKITILRKPVYENPEMAESINSFFTDLLFIRQGKNVIPMSLSDRITYIKQFMMMDYSTITFLYTKDEKTGDPNYAFEKLDGTKFYKLKVGSYPSIDIKFDNSPEDVAARKQASDYIKAYFNSGFVIYDKTTPEKSASYEFNQDIKDKNTKAKDVLDKARQDGAKFVFGHAATADESKSESIAKQVSSLEPNTIFGYPTGSKVEGKEFEYFLVYRPVFNIDKELVNGKYREVKSKTITPDGTIIEFTKDNERPEYNDFIMNNFSTNAVVNKLGNITQVNPSFIFSPTFESSEKINDKLTAEDKAKMEEQVKESVKQDPMTGNNASNVEPQSFFDLFDDKSFQKSEQQRLAENKATRVKSAKGLVWYLGSTKAKNDANFKALYNSLSAAEKKELDKELAEGRTTPHELSKLFPYEVLFRAVNMQGNNPSAEWAVKGIILYSYYKKSKAEASEIDFTNLYHEAWHGFTQTFLTKEERDALYNEASKKEGSFRDFNGRYVTFQSATKKQLDEFLAEDFRTYMMNGGKVSDTKAPVKNSIFRRLLNFFKQLFGKASVDQVAFDPRNFPKINEIYQKISIGDFSSYNFNTQNIDQTMGTFERSMLATDPNAKITEIGYEDANKIYTTVSSMISTYANELNKYFTERKGKEITSYSTQLMKESQFALKVYRDIKIKFENELLPSLNKRIEGNVAEFINMALKREDIKANQTQLDSLAEAVKLDSNKNRTISAVSVSNILNLSPDKVADVLKRINTELATIDNAYNTQQLIQQRDLISWSIDNFGDTTDLSKNTDKGVIAYHLKKSKYEITKTVDEEVEEVNDAVQAEKGKNQYDDLSNKQSQFDIAKADIHYLLGNIHKYDENNKPVLNDLGVQILEDKFVVWNRVSRLLNGEIDPEEMYNILHKAANFGGKNDLIIKQVLQKLGSISPDMTEASARTWISFTNVFSMYNNPLYQMNIEYKGDDKFKVAVGSVNSIQRKVRQIWDNKFRTAEGKHFKRNLDIEADPEHYRKTYLDVASLLSDRRLGNGTSLMDGAAFEFFNSIGVALSDKPEVKRAVTRPDNPVGSAPIIYGRLRDMFARGVTRIYSLNDIFDEFPATKDFKDPLPSQDTNFTELANLETKNSDYTSNYLESNAAGNPQFSLTQHSSLSVMVTLLNKGKSLRQLLTDYPFMQKYNPLTQPAAAVSMELNSMFDVQDFIKGGEGNRRVRNGVPVQYKTGNVAGLRYIDDEMGDVGVETSKLDPYSKLVFDFHSLAFLNRMEFMTPADKSTRLSSYLTYIEGGSQNGKYYIEPISAYENESGYIAAYGRAAEIFSRYLDGEMGRIAKMQELQKRISELADGEYIVYDAAYLKQGQEFIVFEDIISKKLLNQIKGYKNIEEASVALNKPDLRNEIEQEIIDYLIYQVDQVSNVFNEAPFISEDLIQQTNARAKKFGFSPTRNKTTESLVRSYVLNNWINNYESSIMIFGDPAMFNIKKEEYHKRNAGAQSAKTIPVTNKTIIEYVNNKTTSQKDDNGNTIVGSYAMSLNDPTIKEKPLDLNGRVDVAVLEDSVVDSEKIGEIIQGLLDNEIEINAYKLKKLFSKEQEEAFIKELENKVLKDVETYKGMKEGDAQGWIAFDFYRRISMLLDIWTPIQNEMFNKIINKEEFDVNNVSQFFPVLKLQYWGALGVEADMLAVNGYHKFSLFPLIPPVIEGTPLQDIHMKMMRDEIDYAVFKSGSKIGNLNKIDNTGNVITDKFYLDKKRAINNTDDPFAKNPIFLQFLGNQLSIAPEYKEEVTFPTQMRKIIERGYFLDGVPKDFEINESPATRKEKWEELKTDEERAAASEYYKKILTYEKWISALTKFKTKQLKADLGIDGNTLETKEGRAVVTEKLKTFLVNQLESQDIADHEIDFIKTMQGVLANDLSISLSADKLERVLNSLVVRRLVRQKINGEALIQISGAGFERVLRGRLTEEEKAKYNPTNDLPYYGYNKGPNGETSLAKCKIALQGSFKALLNLDDINQQPIRTITRLNEMIRNEEWLNTGNNRAMITIIGPRIPTQENNSVELLEVWEFLPELAGNIVVLPSEIVAKSGGDFDIDKITFIFPQLVTKKDMTFWATIEGDRELKRLAVDNLKYATKLNYFNVNSIIDRQREGEKLNKEEQAIFNIIKKATEEFETLYPLDDTSEKGIVNNLINSIKDLLVQKVAYASLVTPNSTNVLEPLAKDKLAENVMTYNPKGRFREGGDTSRISGTKIFEVLYNLYKHSSNNIGKDILGIIAVANNYSSIFNRIGFHLNAEWEKSEKDKRSMFMLLQHNWIKDDNGKNVISLAGTHDANNEYSIGKIIGQLINGSVDVAKDAWIFFLQGYRETIPTVLFMVKAGVPIKQAIYMVAHPLVRAYVKERQLLDSAIAVPLGILSEEDRYSSIKKLAFKKVLTDPKYGINWSILATTSRNIYEAGRDLIYKNDQVKEKFDKFSIESNLYSRIKDKNYKTNEFDTAVFLHYLHIEEMGEGVTNLIQKTNFDTNPSLSVMSAAMKKDELDELKKDGRYPSKFVDKIITDSPIGSFKIQDFQATLWNPLFNLRHNPVLIDFFVKKILGKKLDRLAKRNGYQSGEVIDFVNSLLNELPNFILQNSINNFDIDSDTEFKGLQIESALPIKKSTKSNFSVKVAAKDGALTLYLDKEALKAEYNDLLTKGKYVDEVKLDESTKVKLAPINISFFANRQSYYRFVMEREILRAQYPGMQGFEELMKRKDVQKRYEDNLIELRATKKAEESEEAYTKRVKAITYEATLRNLALDNSYNMVKMFLSNESMAHQYDAIKRAYPELQDRYSVIKNMEPSYKENLVDGPSKVSNIVLSDVLLDKDRINIYHENMLELTNPAKIQIDTDDVTERRRVADFFNKLSIYAFLQSGQNTSGMFSLVRFMPQTRYNAIIKPLVKNFEKNMNNLTLERFVYKAVQMYNKPAVKTRYKNWQIDTYNVKADKLIAEKGKLTVSEMENIAAGIAAFPIAPKDDQGNYTYTGQTDIIGTALRVGPVAAVPGIFKIVQDIVPSQEPISEEELAKKIQDKLEKLYPEIKLTITNDPIWEEGDNIVNQQEYDNQVNFRLKLVDALFQLTVPKETKRTRKYGETTIPERLTLRLNSKERPYIETNIRKNLQSKGVTNQQIDFIFDYMKSNNIQEISTEDLAAAIISTYSYAVEINTAKEDKGLPQIIEIEPGKWKINNKIFNNKSDALLERITNTKTTFSNTQIYSDLTVPGGTNYTEQEIATPEITPSIKGHAQFATDKGIGWFRSDEQISKSEDKFAWAIEQETGEKPGSNIRRILEVQSDLFQKGRDKSLLIGTQVFKNTPNPFTYNNDVYEDLNPLGVGKYVKNGLPITLQEFAKAKTAFSEKISPENQFLQLLNKDNNWVTFFVKSIIQDSAKKGYEKVLFPSGNTASKVEGHTTLEEFKKQKEDKIKELEKENNNDSPNIGMNNYFSIGTIMYKKKNNVYYANSEIITKENYENNLLIAKENNREKNNREINQLKQELERVDREGFGALKPIYNFYENTLANVLRKQGYNPVLVTDEYGNTWNEVAVYQPRDLSNILLQKDEANRIIGQANLKALTVLIDAVNKKQDTLPHEYAHHYISWYRDSPIVQEAIKKWGSEEALVQSIGEQVVKQRGEAYNWWTRFVKWIMNKFNNLSDLDKQQLTQILTDAFLTRQDLAMGTPKTGKVKEGVAELFESNPELANSVYEALGFKIKSYNKPWRDGSNVNKAKSFALKNKPSEIFELVKDKEDNNYSVHFKTTGKKSLTTEEKQRLIEVVAASIPMGAKLSTWGTVTKGGFAGLERFLQAGFRKTSETRESGGNTIPVYKKTSKSNLEQQAQQLYSQYLDTIFPESKVKDIVYHGTDTKFEKFDKLAVNKLRGKSRTEFIHFTTSFDLAMDYSAQALGYVDAADMYKKAPEKMDDLMQVIPVLIKGNKLSNENVEYGSKFELEQKGISVKDTIFKFGYDLAVFDSEQIHILGSKQDIEGFKKYVEEGVTVEQDPALGTPETGTDDSNPLINPLGPKPVSFDFANATAESMRSQVDDLINYFLEAKANGSTVIFPVTGVGQDLVGVKPQTLAGPMTLKEYADKTSFTFISNREVLRKDEFEYFNDGLNDLIEGRLQYAMFDTREFGKYKSFINKLKENGFIQVEGMPHVFSKGGINPKEEYNKLTQAPAGEINPDTSPLAYQTFLYLSEQLAKHFNYINPNFRQVTAAEPETTVGEKPAEEDVIEFTDEDFKNSFILLDCLYTNS